MLLCDSRTARARTTSRAADTVTEKLTSGYVATGETPGRQEGVDRVPH